jgi:hypothetical protein
MSRHLNDSLSSDLPPDAQAGSSRRQFIRRLAAISAGLTVAAPLSGSATTSKGTALERIFEARHGGAGEIGVTGIPAVIANAVNNAAGQRVRDFPVTLDKLLVPTPGLERATADNI